jgi:outer membrane protein assembly factor BamB
MGVAQVRAVAAVAAGMLLIVGCSSSGSRKQSHPTTTIAGDASPSTQTPGTKNATRAADWATYYGDVTRTGVADDGPSDAARVRKVWTSPTLDGDVYAQPLVVANHVIVATANDTVYSLNATDGTIVWQRHLGEPVPNASLPCGDVDPVGITGTPVVDPRTNRVYAVGLVQPIQHMLFQLDLTTGMLLSNIRVDAPGSDPKAQNQRSALTLANDKVYVPYGGRFGDCGTYHGRVVAVGVPGGRIGAVTSYTLPTQGRGGWWTPPGAAAASDGSLYFAAGNSSSDSAFDYANSVVHLSASLHLLDWWAPQNWQALNASDIDIGSTSPVLVNGNRVFQIGKAGRGYLLDAAHLGRIGGELTSTDVCHGSGAYGGVANDGGTLYVPCTKGVVQVRVDGDKLRVGWRRDESMPGPTVVAGGAVWTISTTDGTLVALDATNGKVLLQQQLGDVPSRFVSPGVGGGRVVAAANRKVMAFGV